MESRAALFGHPLHAILVDFPLALLPTAFLFDLIFLWRKDPFWWRAATMLVVTGLAGAAAAIPFGLADYLLIAMPPQVRILATVHLWLGLGVVAVYAVQIALRRRWWNRGKPAGRYPAPLRVLALLALFALLLQGGLGGELAHIHGVGMGRIPEPATHAPDPGKPKPASSSSAAGRRIFLRDCAGCHGDDAGGKTAPRLLDHRLNRDGIRRTVMQGRFPWMPAWKDRLSPAEIDAAVDYVYALGSGRASGGAAGDDR